MGHVPYPVSFIVDLVFETNGFVMVVSLVSRSLFLILMYFVGIFVIEKALTADMLPRIIKGICSEYSGPGLFEYIQRSTPP